MFAELPSLDGPFPISAIMSDCFRARLHAQIVVADLCNNFFTGSNLDAYILIRDSQCPGQPGFSHQRAEEVNNFRPIVSSLDPFSQPLRPLPLLQVSLSPVQCFPLSWRKFSQHLENFERVFYRVAVKMVVEVTVGCLNSGFDLLDFRHP